MPLVNDALRGLPNVRNVLTPIRTACFRGGERGLCSFGNRFRFGYGGENVNRQTVRARIITTDEIDSGFQQTREEGAAGRDSGAIFASESCVTRNTVA